MIERITRASASVAAMALLTAVGLGAHEGHTHRIMGTISAVHGARLELQTKEGKGVTVSIDHTTTILRGKTPASAADLKPGLRVVIEAESEKEPVKARIIRLGTVLPAPASPR